MDRRRRIDLFHQSLLRDGSDRPGHFLSGWSSETSQSQRFEALLNTSRFSGGSIVDFGCGTGDLFSHLENTGLSFDYIGLEQNADMLKVARQKYNADFRHIDFDEVSFSMSDYVFASGIFQFRDHDNPCYYKDLISLLFDKCERCLAFGLLSSRRGRENQVDDELYFEPCQAIELAECFTQFWALDHSYHIGQGDMTLALHKRQEEVAWRRPETILDDKGE